MDAADGAAGSAGIGLLAAGASVTLDFSPRATPLLAPLIAAERALVLLVCPCLDLRERLRLSPEVPGLRLGVLDLSRTQVVEGIEKTAKIVV
jgi:hypothetical protein|tara:strand:- start:2030 stop:2305 length:276 start_codon:yes stop_codon:yes gene_type:complete